MRFRTKRILMVLLCGILLIAFLLTAIGPQIVLVTSPEGKVTKEYNYSEHFFETYDEVRANLKARVEKLRADGVYVEATEYAINESENLYVDNIFIPAVENSENLIVITTGINGIDGYIGAAMVDVFFEEIYSTIDTSTTGVLVVANVNPYGMKNMRLYNENNVLLNRNFIMDWDSFDRSSNKDYPKVKEFFQPEKAIAHSFWHEVGFFGSLLVEVLTKGEDTLYNAALAGQYEYSEGISYGGNGDEASTTYLKGVFNDCLEGDYDNIIYIDINSGYGSFHDLTIFNSAYETMTESEAVEAFGYEDVISHNSTGFYETTGEATDFFYQLAESKETEKELYSTRFVFGATGIDLNDASYALKAIIDENRQHRCPTDDEITVQVVNAKYKECFYTTSAFSRDCVVEDFKLALEGVLNAKLK